MRSRYVCMVLLLLPAMLCGQKNAEQYFDRYTTSSGLTDNAITEIIQDSTGYVWISTAAGLNRFNGHAFMQLHSNSDSLSLPGEETHGMALLQNRWLAVYSSGLHIIDTKTGAKRNLFIPYHDRNYQFKYNMIVRVTGDQRGHIYVLTRSGFYHFDCCGKLLSRFDYYKEAEVPVTHFYFGSNLFELDSNRLLMISIGGFYVYDKRTLSIKKMEAGDSPVWADVVRFPHTYYNFFQRETGKFIMIKMNSDSITYINTKQNTAVVSRLPFIATFKEFHFRSKLVPVDDSTFYLTGHTAGFYRLTLQSKTGTLVLDTTKYFRNYLCTGLMLDQEKKLWVATNRGLFRENDQRSHVQVVDLPAGTDNRFPDIKLDDIYLSGNKVYAASRGEAGLFIFDKASLRLEKQVLFKGESNSIRSIVSIDPSTLLFATNGHLLLYNKTTQNIRPLVPPSLRDSWCSDMAKDHNGNIWITSSSIHVYQPATGRFLVIPNFQRLLSIPSSLQEDHSGNIWIAGHGLARYNTMLSRFDLVLDSFPYIKMPDKQINFLTVDKQNRIWFNSNNNGLACYDQATRSFRHFTKKEGLPDDNVTSLYVLGNQLWIACHSGIACMDLASSQIISFGRPDGFPELPIAHGARFAYDSIQKQLYIGFTTALVRFTPEEVLHRKLPPRTFIESVTLAGKKYFFLPGETVTTSWQDNEVTVTIGNISYSNESSLFAYRLAKDSLRPWTLIGDEPSFTISGLAPGKHIIQVKTYAASNRWPEQVSSVTIEVLPPLWRKPWFLMIAGLFGVALFYLFIKWRTGLARKKEMEKTQVEKIKADNYKNQFELEHISNYFSSSLAGKRTVEEVLWDVAQNLIGRMNYEDCMIYTWNANKTKMVQRAAYGPKGKPEFISKQRFDVLPGQGVVGHVMNTAQPYLIIDSRTEPLYRVDEAFRLSEICVPIIHNDELIGIIDSEHHQPGYYNDRDIKILTTIATLVGNKIKQIESEQSLDATHRQLDNINAQLAEARLSALQAQMNPHFVFNALNSIKRMILEGDNEKASRYLGKFALMIRMTLDHSKELFVSLEENISYLRSYLEMEQLRFDDLFTYSIETEGNLDITEIALPSMMIQPLVENAIWHGLMPSSADKKIQIQFTEQANRITCVVQDNGIGIRQSEKLRKEKNKQHHSLGLENLRKRIHIMNEKYDLDCRLDIQDLEETGGTGNGTRVTLTLNILNA